MILKFHKYEATGNDFVLIDNLSGSFPKNMDLIHHLCDRKLGIGSDGLILIESANDADFHMEFYNPDGSQSLCGNGSRAAVRLAQDLNLTSKEISFSAFDGIHIAKILPKSIKIKMHEVQIGSKIGNGIFLDTGSPHYVEFIDDVMNKDIVTIGRVLRNSEQFAPDGANINFVQSMSPGYLFVRTYERGVENETLSCGTGVTASALASSSAGHTSPVTIDTKGGTLSVSFEQNDHGYTNIWLEGPVTHVFSGEIDIQPYT